MITKPRSLHENASSSDHPVRRLRRILLVLHVSWASGCLVILWIGLLSRDGEVDRLTVALGIALFLIGGGVFAASIIRLLLFVCPACENRRLEYSPLKYIRAVSGRCPNCCQRLSELRGARAPKCDDSSDMGNTKAPPNTSFQRTAIRALRGLRPLNSKR